MAEQVTGIAGSQSRGRDTATQSRNSRKGTLKKYLIPILIFAVLVLPILWWWRQDGEKTVEKVTESLTSSDRKGREVAVLEKTLQWKELGPDGTAPKGVPSEGVATICPWTIVHADNTFTVEYRDGKPEWRPYAAGSSTTHVRVIALQDGLLPPPFVQTCAKK